ncbi:MAG TPA: tyrosine--tRNA ligase [Candidatus Saccharimonadales bacterium]
MSPPPSQPEITPESVAELTRNAQILIPEEGVYEKLKSAEETGRQLRVKMGFDPTSPDLHLGHAVSMLQLKRFQDLGHLPVIIIGDFTGRIGDPSGRNKSRPTVSAETLTKNAETYIAQLGKVLDISRIEVRRNTEWLENMTVSDLIGVLAKGTLSQTITRDDFRKRLDANSPIGLHEIIYPYLQGLDSVAVDADIEVGGVDQLYAFQAARTLQHDTEVGSEALVLMPLLRGLDGDKKMSKTLGNYVGLNDEPTDMFGKLMSIPDTLIEEYLRLASNFDASDINTMIEQVAHRTVNPMEIKLLLAHNITSIYNGVDAADHARSYFEKQFRGNKESQEYIDTEIERAPSTVDLLLALGAAATRSEARRLLIQGGVSIDGEKVVDTNHQLDSYDGLNVKVGKRRFYRVIEK